MLTPKQSKKIVTSLAAAILLLSPVASMSFTGPNIPSISGSPQVNLGRKASSASDSVINLVVILFSNEKDTVSDTLTSGMIPALEVESVFENNPAKFTSVSVRKIRSHSAQKSLANNNFSVRSPIW